MERRGSGMKKILGEYKHFEKLKKLKKLKPYALQIDIQSQKAVGYNF